MKKLVTLFILLAIIPLFADSAEEHRRAKEAFKRYMKAAHPLPETVKKIEIGDAFLSKEKKLPKFLNVDATIDELASEPNKMQNESSIAVNPKNPNNLIASAVDYRANSSTWVYVSSDGGLTWRNLNLGKPYPNWRSTNDPSVYFDTEGVGYLCYGGFGDVLNSDAGLVGENGVFIAKTTDEGVTWKAHIPVIIHLGNQTMDSTFEDKYYVQVDNSLQSPYHRHVYVPWKRVTPRDSATQIVISKSTDLGESWSEPVNVSHRLPGSSEDTTYGQSFPLASTGPKGELYIVWNHGIEHGVGFSKSYDGGKTFTDPRIIHRYNIFGETRFLTGQGGYRHTVKEVVRAETYPVLITDITDGPRRGTLYLCWSGDNYPNVYFSKSTDEGESWSNPVIVHSDTTNDQFWQWMSIDPLNGDLSIMYLDSRNDAENIMVECYVSYSSDGGNTWIDRRVSDTQSDLRLNPFSGRSFAGDYSGSAFYDGIIYPSWVDMRNAVFNISDSDIFTAIINIRAPEPPDNFENISDFANPLELNFSWEPPTKRAFGQELKPEDFVHKLMRDNRIIATLDGNEDKFSDTDVEPFKMYEYQIYAVAGKDSSIVRELIAYPGGSKQPNAPSIVTIEGNLSNNVSMEIKLPTLRTDSITPIVNLKSAKVYRNKTAIGSITLTPQDTGKTIQFSDNPAELGFYSYKAGISDFFDILQEETVSELSLPKAVFTGSSVESVREDFESIPLPYYFISGDWEVTDEVAAVGSKSISNAPFRQHGNLQFDTLIFLPVAMPEKDDLFMTFMHICSVPADDSALIEISYDDMKSWQPLAKYNRNMYPDWSNNSVSNSDWKFERLLIPNMESAQRVFVRLLFESNTFRNGNGWYLDDVVIGQKSVSVSDEMFSESIRVFPNPAQDYVKIISGNGEFSRVKIFSIHGLQILDYISDNSQDITIDLPNFASGSYFVEITNDNGQKIRKILFINK
ncbi:MAG: T9SS type A sorting domain-containing protein [Candidatus Kapabacteria bacterium]|nr:T9SS type A sorting domain-containing protein [Ignavibacteriota bacterium]MCW5883658.1 T9SS type A sorting domain-containing protein [Candidatus Kapabacteria bacterium]